MEDTGPRPLAIKENGEENDEATGKLHKSWTKLCNMPPLRLASGLAVLEPAALSIQALKLIMIRGKKNETIEKLCEIWECARGHCKDKLLFNGTRPEEVDWDAWLKREKEAYDAQGRVCRDLVIEKEMKWEKPGVGYYSVKKRRGFFTLSRNLPKTQC